METWWWRYEPRQVGAQKLQKQSGEVFFGRRHGVGFPGPIKGEQSEPLRDRLRVHAIALLKGPTAKSVTSSGHGGGRVGEEEVW